MNFFRSNFNLYLRLGFKLDEICRFMVEVGGEELSDNLLKNQGIPETCVPVQSRGLEKLLISRMKDQIKGGMDLDFVVCVAALVVFGCFLKLFYV